MELIAKPLINIYRCRSYTKQNALLSPDATLHYDNRHLPE